MFIIGCLCILFFIIFRRGIKLYQTRLYLANVSYKPPEMKLTGFARLWSWMVPIATVKEEELISSCGLDSYMIVQVAWLGFLMFLPITVLGCTMLLPTYMTQNYLDQQHSEGKVASPSTSFSRATMGNLPRGSPLFWIPFVYVYIVCFYATWLLRRFYIKYVKLRQKYVVQGEVDANQWQDVFLGTGSRPGGKGAPSRSVSQLSSMQRLVSRGRQPSDKGLEEESYLDGLQGGHDHLQRPSLESLGAASVLSQRSQGGGHTHVLETHGSGGSAVTSPLLTRLATRRKHRSGIIPAEEAQFRNQGSAADGSRAEWSPGAGRAAGEPVGTSPGAPAAGQHGRGGLRSASADDHHTSHTPPANLREKARSVLEGVSGPMTVNPVAGFQRPDGAPPGAPTLEPPLEYNVMAPPQPTGGNLLQQIVNQSEAEAARRPGPERMLTRVRSTRSRTEATDNDSVAPSVVMMDGHDNDNGSESTVTEVCFTGTSKYETGDGKHDIIGTPSSPGVTVYKWWQGERDPHGNLLSGKPNVWARKVVNTKSRTGNKMVGVMAQQYVVLVEGVPPPHTKDRLKWRNSPFGRMMELVEERKHKHTTARAAAADAKPSTKGATLGTAEDPAYAAERAEAGLAGGSAGTTGPLGSSNPGTPNFSKSLPRHVQANREADAELNNLAQTATITKEGREGMRRARRSRASSGSTGHVGGPSFKADGDDKVSPPEEDADEVGMLKTRQDVVHELFDTLFPDTYQCALPVLKHKAVDLLLYKWDHAASQLEIAEAAYEKSALTTRPTVKIGGCCCFGGQQVDAINHWAALVRDLEAQVGEARQEALRSEPTSSFFVFFRDQRSAAIAAQVSLQTEDGRVFRASQAPGPEEVNWPTLWESFGARQIRRVLVLIPITAMIIFPIGIFAGSISQLSLLLCGSPSSTAETGIRWGWYCSGNNYIRKLITGVVPPLVLTFWQGIVVPRWFYYWCQAERRATSFTALDQRILDIFYWWSVISVFIGAMLGGSIFSQFRVALESPGKIPSIIGTALPTSSNFFINYVVVQAFAIQPFRYMFPHMGIFPWVFRACGYCKATTARVEIDRLWPHSARGSKEIAFMILIFIIGLAYAAASPIILPCTLLYFTISWTFWRYAVLYFFERCYESGGRLFERVFSQLVFSLFIFEAFTAATFFANSAWTQGTIMLVTLTIYLYEFHKHTVARFVDTIHVDLFSAVDMPPATVDPMMYIPPALRHGCAGWYPEVGKAWEAWNANVYTI